MRPVTKGTIFRNLDGRCLATVRRTGSHMWETLLLDRTVSESDRRFHYSDWFINAHRVTIKAGTLFVEQGQPFVVVRRSEETPSTWRCRRYKSKDSKPFHFDQQYIAPRIVTETQAELALAAAERARAQDRKDQELKRLASQQPAPPIGGDQVAPPDNRCTLRAIARDFNAVRLRLEDTDTPLRSHDLDLLRLAATSLYHRLCDVARP